MALQPKKTIVVLYGLITSGKTTLFEQYKLKHEGEQHLVFCPEPVEKFRQWQRYDPLKMLEDAPIAEAPCVQMHIMSCLEEVYNANLHQMMPSSLAICDGFLDSSSVYIRALERRGCLTRFSRDYLLAILENIKIRSQWGEPNGIYFLDTSLEECLRRIKKRGRTCEQHFITKEYLEHLHDLFQEKKQTSSKTLWHSSKNPSLQELENFVHHCQNRWGVIHEPSWDQLWMPRRMPLVCVVKIDRKMYVCTTWLAN